MFKKHVISHGVSTNILPFGVSRASVYSIKTIPLSLTKLLNSKHCSKHVMHMTANVEIPKFKSLKLKTGSNIGPLCALGCLSA